MNKFHAAFVIAFLSTHLAARALRWLAVRLSADRPPFTRPAVAGLAIAILGALPGCLPETAPAPGWDGAGEAPEDRADPPWLACADVGPCVAWAYCDERGADEEPACGYVADLTCHHAPVQRGLSCFPAVDGAHVGRCDGEGSCR